MDHFQKRGDRHFAEDCSLADLAREHGTPAYVYSRATLVGHCERLRAAFASYPTLPCFAVKANGNLSLLREMFALGFGADLVSIGELERALAAGARPDAIVFSGVGKTEPEVRRALAAGILSFNVESDFELDLLSAVAASMGKIAPVTLRVNPNVDARTHAKIATGLYSTKFGLPEASIVPLAARVAADKHLSLVGLACHIGSQITELAPIAAAAARIVALAGELKSAGHQLKFLDLGGGLGVRYRDESPPSFADYARTLIDAVRPTGLRLVLEPGRVIIANAGVLLTRVIGVKKTPERTFVIVDAGMNDLMRPAMYDAWHEVVPDVASSAVTTTCEIVGPVCETGDYLAHERPMPLPQTGDLLFVRSAGAYGASMASHYNSRPQAPEVLVDGARHRVIRPREDLQALWRDELAALATT